jgi:hypothetical protein
MIFLSLKKKLVFQNFSLQRRWFAAPAKPTGKPGGGGAATPPPALDPKEYPHKKELVFTAKTTPSYSDFHNSIKFHFLNRNLDYLR